jgi:hypothetical protein
MNGLKSLLAALLFVVSAFVAACANPGGTGVPTVPGTTSSPAIPSTLPTLDQSDRSPSPSIMVPPPIY